MLWRSVLRRWVLVPLHFSARAQALTSTVHPTPASCIRVAQYHFHQPCTRRALSSLQRFIRLNRTAANHTLQLALSPYAISLSVAPGAHTSFQQARLASRTLKNVTMRTLAEFANAVFPSPSFLSALPKNPLPLHPRPHAHSSSVSYPHTHIPLSVTLRVHASIRRAPLAAPCFRCREWTCAPRSNSCALGPSSRRGWMATVVLLSPNFIKALSIPT